MQSLLPHPLNLGLATCSRSSECCRRNIVPAPSLGLKTLYSFCLLTWTPAWVLRDQVPGLASWSVRGSWGIDASAVAVLAQPAPIQFTS